MLLHKVLMKDVRKKRDVGTLNMTRSAWSPLGPQSTTLGVFLKTMTWLFWRMKVLGSQMQVAGAVKSGWVTIPTLESVPSIPSPYHMTNVVRGSHATSGDLNTIE